MVAVRYFRAPAFAAQRPGSRVRAAPEGAQHCKAAQAEVARCLPSGAAEPEIIAVEKLPDAKVVLVVGDFLASGLAEGLADSFAQNAAIRILDRSKGSSGLVREDVFDWPKEIAAMIDAEKPAAIVVMLGSNDRQQMLVGGKRETFNSEGWVDAYENRAAALATAIGSKKIPFVWVSMPPFKSSKMSSDMLAFNGIYKAALGSNGGVRRYLGWFCRRGRRVRVDRTRRQRPAGAAARR